MMQVPVGVRVHIAAGVTDLRKGLDGLAMRGQRVLRQDPISGHLFAFRGTRANLVKLLYWDGTGLCLFTKRLETGGFALPAAEGAGDTVVLTPVQLSMLPVGIDWRGPERRLAPMLAG